jgi:hypothetical protein
MKNLRSIPSRKESIPSPKQIGPFAEGIDPFAEENDPFVEGISSLTEENDPFAKGIDSLAEEIDPFAKGIDSLAEEIDSLAEQIVFFTEDIDSFAEEIDVSRRGRLRLSFNRYVCKPYLKLDRWPLPTYYAELALAMSASNDQTEPERGAEKRQRHVPDTPPAERTAAGVGPSVP